MTAVCRSSFQDGGQLFQRSRAAKWNRCAKAFIRSNKEAKSASTNKGGLLPKTNHPTVVQISLDFTDIKEAIETAHTAVEAGVDWLEAGTPLILAEGLRSVRALRDAFPCHPIVADLKTMDGGYLEAEMMAKAGATHVVVMARAHVETIKAVVKAGRDYGIKVMGDNLGCEDKPAASRTMEDLGVDYIVHHTGYDERNGIAAAGGDRVSPLD